MEIRGEEQPVRSLSGYIVRQPELAVRLARAHKVVRAQPTESGVEGSARVATVATNGVGDEDARAGDGGLARQVLPLSCGIESPRP